MVQLMPLHPGTPSSLASFKSGLIWPFWYRLTHTVLEKKLLNGSSSSSSVMDIVLASDGLTDNLDLQHDGYSASYPAESGDGEWHAALVVVRVALCQQLQQTDCRCHDALTTHTNNDTVILLSAWLQAMTCMQTITLISMLT